VLTVAWCALTVAGHVWIYHMNEGRDVSGWGGVGWNSNSVYLGRIAIGSLAHTRAKASHTHTPTARRARVHRAAGDT
jgi:hypothetical protein